MGEHVERKKYGVPETHRPDFGACKMLHNSPLKVRANAGRLLVKIRESNADSYNFSQNSTPGLVDRHPILISKRPGCGCSLPAVCLFDGGIVFVSHYYDASLETGSIGRDPPFVCKFIIF